MSIIGKKDLHAVVLHFRTAEHTLNCLRSLKNEGVINVVIVDNSEDGGASLSSISGGILEMRTLGVNIKILTAHRNLGFAGGVNKAIDWICDHGKNTILFLNSDAKLLPDAIDSMLSVATAKKAVVAPLIISADHSVVSPMLFYHKYFSVLLHRKVPGSFGYLCGACMLVPKEFLRRNFFDEDFFFYGEDVFLSYSLTKQNIPQVVDENSKVFHAGSGSAKSGSLFYEYHINLSHFRLAAKLAENKFYLMLMLICRLITLPARASVRSFRLRSFLPLKGFFLAFYDFMKRGERNISPG